MEQLSRSEKYRLGVNCSIGIRGVAAVQCSVVPPTFLPDQTGKSLFKSPEPMRLSNQVSLPNILLASVTTPVYCCPCLQTHDIDTCRCKFAADGSATCARTDHNNDTIIIFIKEFSHYCLYPVNIIKAIIQVAAKFHGRTFITDVLPNCCMG